MKYYLFKLKNLEDRNFMFTLFDVFKVLPFVLFSCDQKLLFAFLHNVPFFIKHRNTFSLSLCLFNTEESHITRLSNLTKLFPQ